MSPRELFDKWWRITLLVVLVSVALYAVFVPGGVFGDPTDAFEDEDDEQEFQTGADWHNLVFGLTLDGGAKISAPAVGMHADEIDIDDGEAEDDGDLRIRLADEMDIERADVRVFFDEDIGFFTAEVVDENATKADFAAGLTALGYEYDEDDISAGVTAQTRDDMTTVIEDQINEAGLSGGRAYVSQTLGGEHFIVTEAPGITDRELRQTLEDRGQVEVRAYYPNETGQQVNETVIERDDLDAISSAREDGTHGHHVEVSLREESALEYQSFMNTVGFTTEGQASCTIRDRQTGEFDFDHDDDQWCLLTVSDGEVASAHSLSPDLAENMRQETWADRPIFIMSSETQQEAHQLSINLRAGHLPAPLDFAEGQVQYIEPALAEQFKVYSLVIGFLAILTVSGMVYFRYRDPRVALPMILTAMAEVIILLGFAAALRMPLDLAHVAGFIAVVGTGVDDLIIIADQVMDEGEVNQRRVFDSRFRKAFWIIGAAAATTIIAMSPLAVLSLGDLQGFAIVTILGVLIGVLVTRPAYGDILRKLMTDEK